MNNYRNGKLCIDVVLQATGTHGWSCSLGWVNVLKREGLLNRVFTPIAAWEAEEPIHDDGLFEYLKNPQADIILMPGFDWHSQPLHKTIKWQERWHQAQIIKIALLQECYSAEVVQNTLVWRNKMYQALISTLSCIDALICHHEPDVNLIKNHLGISVPAIFLPFSIDAKYFKNQRPFTDRLNRALFRGNAPRHFTENTYKERYKLIEALSVVKNVDLFPSNLFGQKEPFEIMQEYICELNFYRILLNLPSLAPTFTVRPFEIMACGGLLLQNRIIGEQSQALFQDWEHLVYYDADQPKDLIDKIEYLIANPELSQKIAKQGEILCHQLHTTEYRINSILKWVNNDFQSMTFLDNVQFCNTFDSSQIKNTATKINLELAQTISISSFKIIVDGVFFQINKTGIARVWTSLLKEWVNNGFAKYIVVLDRAGTAPKISGIKYRTIASYDYNNTDADREMLQQVCDEEGAEVFISSYYTTPTTTPCIFIAYDMIPEVMGWDINSPMWREKHQAIQNASQYIAISEHTARDLVNCFPEISRESITVAHCGVESTFSPASIEEINIFKTKYGITKPYFMLVGIENNYKNSILFFQAFSQLASSSGFDIVCTGNRGTLAPEFRSYTLDSIVHILQLSDRELATAYSGAVALAYPSKYEGFGLPIVEAMACGCPVITCPNASIPEVAGEAAIYVNDNDVNALANALCEVQKSSVRNSLITAGLAQAKKFSWSTMANTVSGILIKGTILHLNLKEINLIVFPDWSQPEDLINLNLEIVIKTLAAYSDSQKTTLIIDTSDIASEDAAILLSGVTMNLLMQEDLDITEGLEISLLGNLANIQWAALLPRISARIILEHENKQALEKYQQMLEQGNKFNGLIEEYDVKKFIYNYDLSNSLDSLVSIYQQENSNTSVLKELCLLRRQIAESLIDKEKDLLEKLYLTKFGEAYQALLNSGIQNESITEAEKSFVNDVLARVAKRFNEPNAIQYLLVAMLYCRSHQLPLVYDLTEIPSWLLNDYLKFAFQPPLYFQKIGEVDNYYQYMENLINYLHINIISNSESKLWQDIAEYFTYTANFIPLYFNEVNLKNIYTKRADIIKLYLQKLNQSIEYEFPERLDERVKVRMGILASHYSPQTETFASLSVYKHLNRDLFEVILFTLNVSNHRLERYCVGNADALIKLPTNLTNQVETIRESDLDILFISTNVTAVTHQITLLSLYRLARIQVVDANSPVTTGMPHIDYYISSKLSETEDNAQEHYSEQLITLNSPPQCFDFATEEQILATDAISRESLGIEKTAIVYVSGANYYKIIPEQEVTWAKIIASVPNSVLLLYPFNPNWSSSYPCIAFRKRIITTFAKYGLSEDRLIILDPAPNRADVKERLKLCDIYLDSYPYSGMTSLIDPLEVGLPTVVMETEPSRSRKGASLLRELQIFDLITNSEEAYIELAAALGISSELRQQKSEQIKQKMHQNPIFLDSRSHSSQMGELFQELFYKHQAIALKEQLNLKDINLIIFPDWSQPEDLLYQDLASVISTLTTHPNKSRLTLLIDTHNVSEDEADMLLSSLTMNLLMEGDVDITEGPEISLLGKMSNMQWKTLLPRIHTRIALATDNQFAIAQAKAENLPSCDVDSLSASKLEMTPL